MNLFFGYILVMLRSETIVYKYIPMPQTQLSRSIVASTTNKSKIKRATQLATEI